MELDIPRNFSEFTVWLGSPVVVGFIVSWLAEQSGLFAGLTTRFKHIALLGVSLAFPAISYVLQGLPQETLDKIAPVWEGVLYPALVIYFGSQVAHWLRKRNETTFIDGEGLSID